jgi:hypothetical protein
VPDLKEAVIDLIGCLIFGFGIGVNVGTDQILRILYVTRGQAKACD